MKISIHDYANSRVIVADVPEYLLDTKYSLNTPREDDDVAQAIFDALGLSSGSCDYMMGEFSVVQSNLEDLVQNFKEDALESLKESA